MRLAPSSDSLDASVDQVRKSSLGWTSLLASVVFVVVMLGFSYLAKNLALAVYALGFWHYYLYALAYYFGAVSLGVFKRDAILMKAVSLVTLGYVYLSAPLDIRSLAVVTAGFLLNGVAARALGSDRTYYGMEVADLPPRRIMSFPYSWISHPMLLGNMAAFGGTLINADFRRQWWPLACMHVAMNLGLLVMELAITPQRRGARPTAPLEAGSHGKRYSMLTACGIVTTGAMLAAALGSGGTWNTKTLLAAGAGACLFAYAYALYCCYSVPTSLPDKRREIQAEITQ